RIASVNIHRFLYRTGLFIGFAAGCFGFAQLHPFLRGMAVLGEIGTTLLFFGFPILGMMLGDRLFSLFSNQRSEKKTHQIRQL
ncbi:MAG: hypothetical protein GY940_40975, partial [bacterium]|nr:hypothetical protein [bacterium]